MGSKVSKILSSEKAKRISPDEIPKIPNIDVKIQMNYIICHWCRLFCNAMSIPVDIIDSIINIYLYQVMFDISRWSKLNDHPEPFHILYSRYAHTSIEEYEEKIAVEKKIEKVQFKSLYKVLLTGDQGVGKSAFFKRSIEGIFSNEKSVQSTLTDFGFKTVNIDDFEQKLQIWDLWGSDKFARYRVNYYRGAHIIMLIYDVTNRESFQHIKDWNLEIDAHRTERNCERKVAKILVGNKVDLISKYNNDIVSYEEGKKMAQELNIPHFIETSAKTGDNVDNAFECVAEQYRNVHGRLCVRIIFPFYG